MIIIENFVKREATPEEIAEFETESKKAEALERTRPLTEAEVLRMLIAEQINTLEVDDNTALRMKAFYPEWSGKGKSYSARYKVLYLGKLYRVRTAHTSQADYTPVLAPALFEVINETNAGTLEDPIPYDGNMALKQGKYYTTQNGEFYLCTRDTVDPVYDSLSWLVGHYVEVVR